ncbi:MAG: NAD(P)/FAD-dependent oxidoreductase [Thermoanaerobaculia bacterium]
MTNDFDVIIVGGGVGGAALALALGHAYPLRILLAERRSGPGNANRGDSLLPAVTTHLAAWGALDRFKEAGARSLSTIQMYDDAGAGLLFQAPLVPPGSPPYLVLPHPQIERVLHDAARATGRVEVRYRCRAERLLEENGSVRGAHIAEEENAAREITASLVVGADGSSSALRAALQIPFESTPYDHSFFIVDVDRPPGYEDVMRIELCAEGGILVVPQGDDRCGLGVLVHGEQEQLFRTGTIEEKLAAIGRRTRLLVGRRAFPGAHLYKVWRGHAPRYVARGAALLGDAVHVTNPTAGQGMTMAIEDAASLARHVGPALAAGESAPRLGECLTAYERERHPANDGLIRWSHWMSRIYAFDSGIGSTLRRGAFGLAATPLGRFIHRKVWTRVATRGSA